MHRIVVVLTLGCVLGVVPALGQSSPMERGILAFRAERYEEARNAFEDAIEAEPDNAQAHYLLARLYFETPLQDNRAARRALDTALELEPDNLQYLVAQLEFLRRDSQSFLTELIRGQKRRVLARQILEIDPANAFANEELGVSYIADFWRYRNAFELRELDTFWGDSEFGGGRDRDSQSTETGEDGAPQIMQTTDVFEVDIDPSTQVYDDTFSEERLTLAGLSFQDLSERGDQAYERAVVHLTQALEADPRRRSVYTHLFRVYILREEYRALLGLIQGMMPYFSEDADMWLALGLANYRTGQTEAAEASFKRAFELLGADRADAYRRIDALVSRDDRGAYLDDPEGYTRRFWTSKDPRFLTAANERELEHYSRLFHAELFFSVEGKGVPGWETDRGEILLRYGVPDQDVIWIIRPQIGTLAGADDNGQALTGALPLQLDVGPEGNTFNIWDYGDFEFVFEDPGRSGHFRLYAPPANVITQLRPSSAWAVDYDIKARETFAKIPERFTFRAPGRTIDVPMLTAAFKAQDGTPEVVVSYGIPVNVPDAVDDVIPLTANVGAFLISDSFDILAERRRTLYGLNMTQVRSFDEASLWVGSQVLPAPPGEHAVSFEVETAGGTAAGVQRRDISVPAYSADAFQLSDLLLAYSVEEGEVGRGRGVQRRGFSILPAPWSVFAVEQPIYLYFEMYGLDRDAQGRTSYEIEAALVPKDDGGGVARFFRGIFGGGDRGVSVTLPGQGSSEDEGQYLIFDAQNQEPGVYTLVLRVRDLNARTTQERRHDLLLE